MNRISFLDYAKALSILFVISVHVGFSRLNHVLLFAMPLFFLVTGYTFQATKRTWREHVLLRFKAIMLPFWGFMLLYTIIEMLRAELFAYSSFRMGLMPESSAAYMALEVILILTMCLLVAKLKACKRQKEVQ